MNNEEIFDHILTHKDSIYLLDLKTTDGYPLVAEYQKIETKSIRTRYKLYDTNILLIFACWNGNKLKSLSDKDRQLLKDQGYYVDLFLPKSIDYSNVELLLIEITNNLPSELNS